MNIIQLLKISLGEGLQLPFTIVLRTFGWIVLRINSQNF